MLIRIRDKHFGFALITTLLMAVVLLLMVLSLLLIAHRQNFLAQSYFERQSALCTAEAGIAVGMSRLFEDPSWTGPLKNQKLSHGLGEFDLVFTSEGSGALPGPFESVNNFHSSVPAASHHGLDTVPPRSALLICRARAGRSTRTLEVLLTRGSGLTVEQPLMASGHIHLKGKVQVAGIASFEDDAPVEAGIHTNSTDKGITWQANSAGDRVQVDGVVSARNDSNSAIDLGSDTSKYDVKGVEVDAPLRPLPSANIPATVASKAGNPAPPLGLGTVLLSEEEYFHGGDMEVHGDLVLTGSALYVQGDPKVNGSIRGDGSVYVVGDTQLRGSSQVSARDQDQVAILSQGHVHLSGFDGTAYLKNFANNDIKGNEWWKAIEVGLDTAKSYVNSNTVEQANAKRPEMVTIICTLGQESGSETPLTGSDPNAMGRMGQAIGNLPGAGETELFLSDRLENLALFFRGGGAAYGSDEAAVEKYFATGHPGALFDAVVDLQRADLWPVVRTLVNDISFDRVGESFFQGVIYTNGSFIAEHEVTIFGGLIAHDNGSQEPLDYQGEKVSPGDVLLLDGTRLVYVASMFDDQEEGEASGHGISMATWLSR